ncbi:hypothetical protein DFH11DRAFT_1732789 [Phellopilus nigrolimitatus]|nr:hypothetical protein DFH11DRAFT_1732789 [Phellopilus nigrolimitatus]
MTTVIHESVCDKFKREGERNYIVQVVCEATQSPSVSVQVGVFESLCHDLTIRDKIEEQP